MRSMLGLILLCALAYAAEGTSELVGRTKVSRNLLQASVLTSNSDKGVKPAPVAQLLGNPPGKWNNNGQGLNTACIPFASSAGAAPPTLADPGWVYTILGVGNVPASALGFETTVTLNILATNQLAMWNAIAPYTPPMQLTWNIPGVTTQPTAQQTLVNKNIALSYASLAVYKAVLPEPLWRAAWTPLFSAFGLDVDNNSTDPNTPIGIGNLVGAAAVQQYTSSNWNTLGAIGYSAYKRPYADWTGFVPVNTAYDLSSPLNWQPLLETTGLGYFQVQSHITPQATRVEPLLADKDYISTAKSPEPYPNGLKKSEYKAQADTILALSAGLTDAQKMAAEYFDDKALSFGVLAIATTAVRGWSLDQFLLADMNIPCMVDASALVWREKLRHNAVRPISAIRQLYGNSNVSAWLQFKGTQNYPGREWTSYLRTMPHADYPSFTACVCSIFGNYMRNMTGSNTFPAVGPITFPAGCSRREPGLTPAADTSVTYTTWDQFIDECAQTRAYAGVHFQRAIDEGKRLCAPIGTQCYKKAYKLRYGNSSTPSPV